jgi:hypothetical protein
VQSGCSACSIYEIQRHHSSNGLLNWVRKHFRIK